MVVKDFALNLEYQYQIRFSHCHKITFTLACKHHSTFGRYQDIAQLLNRNKMGLLALYNNKY